MGQEPNPPPATVTVVAAPDSVTAVLQSAPSDNFD
eukprot:gene14696-17185_t